ncbi:hypothetical protein N1495_04605 [Streptococcus didelphis]|uniref:Cyclic nucleotide-binding domain-containing protein n=1 Tax=Streptococcus didelphis TaxID=102886 RepID=A0ABY9LH45_9STRE|nr:hypothetical protein [Streptococcus didelphis]WMB28186.1 hypothetical protein N1496_00190 [Streptococcus didelphis]WMB30097.1 hypothetical protein N1495_04605 [Streptococcus didelphis]
MYTESLACLTQSVLEKSQDLELKNKECLNHCGQKLTHLYYIINGKLKISYLSENSKTVLPHFLKKGIG